MKTIHPCANCGHAWEGRAHIGDTAYGNTIDDSDCDYEDEDGCNEENGFKGWIPREEERMTENLQIGNIWHGLVMKKIDDLSPNGERLEFHFTIYDEGDRGTFQLTDDEMRKIVDYYEKTRRVKE